jgi:hypothetical protein
MNEKGRARKKRVKIVCIVFKYVVERGFWLWMENLYINFAQ